MMRYQSTLSTLLTAIVLMGLLAAPAQAQNRTPGLFALAQFIHNIPDAGPVDVYLDDVRMLDDLAFQNASPFMPVLCPNFCKATLDLVAGDEPDNSNPLFTADVVLQADVLYSVVALGVLSAGVFEVLGLDDLRTEARAPGVVEYLLINGVPGPAVDILLLDENGACDPTDPPLPPTLPPLPPVTCSLLVNNWEFGEAEGYWQLEPRMNYFQVNTAEGDSLLTVGFDFTGYEDETVTILGSPFLTGGGTLIAFDSDGNKIEPMDLPRTVETLPTETLAVEGNYPNPFNPTTSIRFDLAEPATVRLQVIDVLGRTVMTKPAQRFEAGAGHTFTVNASSLASGIYLYRVIAQTDARTLMHTGRMILSK